MSFISFAFVALYLFAIAARLSIGWTKQSKTYLRVLLFLSIVFYLWHVPEYFLIVLYVTIVAFFSAIILIKKKIPFILCFSIAATLFPLLVFKYLDFFIQNYTVAVGGDAPTTFRWLLPLGISFFSFQALSYTIDVYRGRLKPVDKFFDLFLFIIFFPQLVAGPIVKAKDFLYQLPRKRPVRADSFLYGLYIMVQGFFLKMVCADNLAHLVDSNWPLLVESGTFNPASIAVVIGFSFQIFCDFAGYSMIAQGVGYQLGFRLPINFNSPYLASSFSGFWRRWHITLSEWFRDYFYIPLGGNRKGVGRTLVNLMATMIVCGLWHGASWCFVVWGALHGMGLAVERGVGPWVMSGRLRKIIWFCIVQLTVLVGWVFFRASDLSEAFGILRSLVDFSSVNYEWRLFKPVILFSAPALIMHARQFLVEKKMMPVTSVAERCALFGVMVYFILTGYGHTAQFVYFQF